MAEVTKGILNYSVRCDSNRAQGLAKDLLAEGWELEKASDSFSPITSFWSAVVTKGSDKIQFAGDEWFTDIRVPKAVWKEYGDRISAIPM